jgi:beta-galactosidase
MFLRVFLILFCFSFSAFSQNLILGGLQGSQTLVITPSPSENDKIKFKKPQEIDYLGFKPTNDKHIYEFTPKLPKEWHWIAVFNAELNEKKYNFFYYDSWVGTTEKIKTSGRRRDFPNDITARIKSNVYHIALQREFVAENETFLLLVSPKKQKVIVELPAEIYKTQRRLEYEMGEWEAKFVHIVVPPEEYTNVTWKEFPELREKVTLKNWKFRLGEIKDAEKVNFSDKNWQNVQVPHTWNADDIFDYRNLKDTLDITEMYRRDVAWYRTTFTIPEKWRKNKYLRINFLGANQVAEVWLNGKYLGKHEGGYTDFHFGIMEAVELNKTNILAVKVDNRFNFDIAPHTADYNFLGGIYREVELMAWNPLFVKDIAIITPKVSHLQAEIEANITLNNKSKQTQKVKVITNLINPQNEICATQVSFTEVTAEIKPKIQQKFSLNEPILWSPETPYLYRAITTIFDEKGNLLDQKSENFGLRFFEFTADKGFFLNGKKTKLKGVNVHQDFLHKGWAVDSSQKRQDFVLIKKMGANYVRLSHYPHHPYVLHLCDSLGLIVWAEIPVVNTVGREAFVKNAVKQMEEMIYRDKNHPSILMWGVGNEYYRESFDNETAEWALKCTEAVAKKAKELDPYRLTVQAQNDLVDDRIMAYTDIQGRNRYFGWYSGGDVYAGIESFDGFGKMMLQEHERQPNWKILVSEYGAEGKIGFHVPKPRRFDHSETYQIAFHKAYWEFIKKHDWVIGGTIWNMFDFASWAKIGNIPHINQKGTMTYDRKPKSLYYYYQSQWAEEPMVYIFSHTQTHRKGKKGEKQDLEVFSNCEEVEIWLNGKWIGAKSQKEGYTWKVDLQEGSNEVKAVGYKQGEKVSDKRVFYFSYQELRQENTQKGDNDSD